MLDQYTRNQDSSEVDVPADPNGLDEDFLRLAEELGLDGVHTLNVPEVGVASVQQEIAAELFVRIPADRRQGLLEKTAWEMARSLAFTSSFVGVPPQVRGASE